MRTDLMNILLVGLFVAVFLFLPGCKDVENELAEADIVEEEKKFKILYVMSYHSPWKWTDDQLEGFNEGLSGLDVEYKIFQMDTKRKSSEEWKIESGRQARELIDSWEPDLVYTTDDNVQEYVVKHYINTTIPFVFSGVNAAPEKYGFVGSTNVAGVMEQEHFVETVKLLKDIKPDVEDIAVIIDDGATWQSIIDRMKSKQDLLPGIDFVSWDTIHTFEGYKQRIAELQDEADAIALLGIFTYKDEEGENVPYQEVLEWTAENSNIPDFSFWKDRISFGTLCTVTVSGYEQGLAAGKIARGILAENKSPSEYPFEPTVKGEPVISLARADKLGIPVESGTLLSSEVIERFEWEK